jgi:hypothetical protein
VPARGRDENVGHLRKALEKLRGVISLNRLLELLLDHHGVGNRFRREVVVRIEVGLLYELPRGTRGLGELPQLLVRIEIVVPIL